VKLVKLSSECAKPHCPGVFFDEEGSLFVQGPLEMTHDVLGQTEPGPGEGVVRIRLDMVADALRKLD
jgi:hypothetical protein